MASFSLEDTRLRDGATAGGGSITTAIGGAGFDGEVGESISVDSRETWGRRDMRRGVPGRRASREPKFGPWIPPPSRVHVDLVAALLRLPAVFKLKASEARVPCASRGAPCVLSTDNPPDRRLEVMRGAGWARASNLRDLYGWRWACTPSVQGGEARDRYPGPKPKLFW